MAWHLPLLELLVDVWPGATLRARRWPRVALHELDAGVLSHMDPKGALGLVLILLWAMAGPHAQGGAGTDGKILGAA